MLKKLDKLYQKINTRKSLAILLVVSGILVSFAIVLLLLFPNLLFTNASVDLDGDGYDDTVDCNDSDATINPGATEVCDGVDNNCDGNIDEGLSCQALTTCQALTAGTYYLANDILDYSGICFPLNSANITVNGNGKTLSPLVVSSSNRAFQSSGTYDNIEIFNTIFEGDYYAIYSQGSGTFHNNTISDSRYGIYAQTYSEIYKNTFNNINYSSSSSAISIDKYNHHIYENDFNNCSRAIVLATEIQSSSTIDIYHNNFDLSNTYDIYVEDYLYDPTINADANYWGIFSCTSVEDKIFDEDDGAPGYYADVAVKSYLDAPYPGGSVVVCPIDTDGDGIPDSVDNCKYTPNPSQENSDGEIVYLEDSFENLNTFQWSSFNPWVGFIGGRSSVHAHSGSYSLYVANSTNMQKDLSSSPETGTVSVWFYDDMSSAGAGDYAYLYLSSGSGESYAGLDYDISSSFYKCGSSTVTSVPRSLGWHEFQVETTGSGTTTYIDSTPVCSSVDTSINEIYMYSSGLDVYWDDFSFNGSFTNMTDGFEALQPWSSARNVAQSGVAFHGGSYSVAKALGGGGDLTLEKTFTSGQEGELTGWFYDDGSASPYSYISVSDSSGSYWANVGMNYDDNYYACDYANSTLARSTGWHSFKFDTTVVSGTDIYIDDTFVCNDPDINAIGYFQIEAGEETKYWDDIRFGNASGDTVGDVCDICPYDATNQCNVDAGQDLIGSASGGTVETVNALGSVEIPAGALSGDEVISIEKSGSNFHINGPGGPTDVVASYEIEPTGLIFNSPVIITIYFDPLILNSADAYVYYSSDGGTTWTAHTGAIIERGAGYIRFETNHFSSFGVGKLSSISPSYSTPQDQEIPKEIAEEIPGETGGETENYCDYNGYIAPLIPIYNYEYISQSDYVALDYGETKELTIKIKNIGNVIWKKSGHGAVRLGTQRWQDRPSAFDDGTWLSDNRINFEEACVKPGEIATFRFNIKADSNIVPGLYREYFGIVADGIAWMRDVGIYWDIALGDEATVMLSSGAYNTVQLSNSWFGIIKDVYGEFYNWYAPMFSIY